MQLRDVLKASLQSEQKEVRRRGALGPAWGHVPASSGSSGAEHERWVSPASPQDAQAKQNAGYSLHQLQGNKAHGTERSGVLYKRSEG